jgi:subtilisin family serine protease
MQALIAAAGPGEILPAWVVFRDKGQYEAQKAMPPRTLVSRRSLERRLKVLPPERAVDAGDLPLEPRYVEFVASRVMRVRQQSKWFNRVSVDATPGQLRSLAALPCVASVEPLVRLRRNGTNADLEAGRPDARARKSTEPRTASLDYGPSLSQVQIMNVPALHDQGITGANVLVGHFDNGYRLLSHEVFASTQIVAGRDFVDHDADPAPPVGSPSSYGAHGIATLSVLGGNAPGQLIGVAYGASYVIARTENDASETPLEEDNWVAAIEWADSLGIDVASTSLGYLDFDPGFTSWTWENMDGNTTVITRAADHAVELGIVVLNSAGNEGFNADHNTLIAPADGDSVLSIGAVTSAGDRSSFSSVGPTTDNPPRIKPDVMGQGSAVRVARTTGIADYGSSSGTSFSCPLVAGVATLLLQARPSATPMQIRDALRETASNAGSPNNLMGWGIVSATAALGWLNATDVTYELPTRGGLTSYPNPFNPTTTIVYRLLEPAVVTVQVFDARGRLVQTVAQGALPAQSHQWIWNGRDTHGRPVPSGAYFCRVQAAQDARVLDVQERKLILLR